MKLRASPRVKQRRRELLCIHKTSEWLEKHQNSPGRIDSHGYLRIPCLPKLFSMSNGMGKVLEHRQVVALEIGRPLSDGEVVHHIDGDKLNNNPSNLVLFASALDHHVGNKPIWDGSANEGAIGKLKSIWNDIFCMCMCSNNRGQGESLEPTSIYGDGYWLCPPSTTR